MENIDVTWEIVGSTQNTIMVEYKHPGVQKIIIGISLYADDIPNVAAIIQEKAPYMYFYNALHPALSADVAALIGQTGSGSIPPPQL